MANQYNLRELWETVVKFEPNRSFMDIVKDSKKLLKTAVNVEANSWNNNVESGSLHGMGNTALGELHKSLER
jgi:hypothetical protein